jgi:signal transduction histidine kinase
MPSKNELHFEVSANLQKLIGEELVSNDEMAFIELVKNAYDSGASIVEIAIYQETLASTPRVTVRDDGQGMPLPDFQRRFMLAGYSERDLEATTATRVPTGEKGIGRFATDKIGAELVVTTRAAGEKQALQVTFDWNAFRQKGKKFGEIRAPYEYVTVPDGMGATGTILSIQRLRSKWDRAKIDSLREALRSLFNPYSKLEGFQIRLNVIGLHPSSETIAPEKPVQHDYELQFKVAEDNKVLRRLRAPLDARFGDWKVIPGLAPEHLFGLKGRMLYYLKKPPRAFIKGLPAGVQLYRDGFLMQPFGAPISDRLKLIEKRAKRAGHAPLVPNRLFGFVEISRLTHPTLKDTTSRQAMLETAELHDLVRVLKSQTDFLEENLLEDVKKPSWRKSARQQSIVIEQARLNSLGNLSVGIGHEIRQPLQSIFSHADAIELRLQAIGIVDDGELTTSLGKINEAGERIDATITFIKQLSSGDLEDVSTFDLAETVRKELKIIESQNDDIKFRSVLPRAQLATANQTTVLHILANLLRNSVEAIREVQDERKGAISVKVTRDADVHIIEVEDNGVGIDEATKPKIFKQFNTQKTGGLGFGLTYCHTIVEAQGGRISFTSKRGVGTTFRVEMPEKHE